MWWRAILSSSSSSPSIAATASCATPKWTKPVLNQSFLGGIYCGAKVAVATCFPPGCLGKRPFLAGKCDGTCIHLQRSNLTLDPVWRTVYLNLFQSSNHPNGWSRFQNWHQDLPRSICQDIKFIIHQARYTVIYRCIRMIMTHELLKQVIPSTPKHRHEKSRVAARPRRLSP